MVDTGGGAARVHVYHGLGRIVPTRGSLCIGLRGHRGRDIFKGVRGLIATCYIQYETNVATRLKATQNYRDCVAGEASTKEN